jgi:hypothetical protein
MIGTRRGSGMQGRFAADRQIVANICHSYGVKRGTGTNILVIGASLLKNEVAFLITDN